jgi:hypothetical protein
VIVPLTLVGWSAFLLAEDGRQLRDVGSEQLAQVSAPYRPGACVGDAPVIDGRSAPEYAEGDDRIVGVIGSVPSGSGRMACARRRLGFGGRMRQRP